MRLPIIKINKALLSQYLSQISIVPEFAASRLIMRFPLNILIASVSRAIFKMASRIGKRFRVYRNPLMAGSRIFNNFIISTIYTINSYVICYIGKLNVFLWRLIRVVCWNNPCQMIFLNAQLMRSPMSIETPPVRDGRAFTRCQNVEQND